MNPSKRQFLGSAAALCLTPLVPAWAQSSEWPTRPVRIVVPYPPGGSSDIIARILAPRLADLLKQTVVVENKPGANGNVGAGLVVQSAQEGHTVLLCDVGALAISPSVYTKLTFDPSKDLRAVGMLAYSPHVLAVHPDVPAKTVQDLVELSKKQRINFAVTAIGSAPHLAAVAVQQATGAQWEYVPYKGGSQAVTDTIGGQTQIIMNGLLATLPHIKSGKLKAIAVTGSKRSPVLPDVPTFAEASVPGVDVYAWQAVVAPKNLPADVRDKLSASLTAALKDPALSKPFTDIGLEVVANSPEAFTKFQQQESARWKQVIETGGISVQ